jgi:beta-phosphoglucomutase-like phosphatase (HAD superfamily)
MDQTWVIEDSVLALDTAHKAGFLTVGVYDCHNHDPERVRALSTLYIADGEGLDRLIGTEF